MAIKTAQVALNSSTATQLMPQGTTAGHFPNVTGTVSDPIPVVLENIDGSIVVYLGASTVTSGTGLSLAAGASIAFNFVDNDMTSLYAISASGTPNLAVLAGRQ